MAQRGPKSEKILIWMGLGAFSESLARSGQNFGRSRAQDAQSWGQDGTKLGPRWSILASRWASWGELGRSWEHLGPNMVDLGGVLGRILEAFWDMGGRVKTYGFPLVFNDFDVFWGSGRESSCHLGAYVGRCWVQDGFKMGSRGV